MIIADKGVHTWTLLIFFSSENIFYTSVGHSETTSHNTANYDFCNVIYKVNTIHFLTEFNSVFFCRNATFFKRFSDQ